VCARGGESELETRQSASSVQGGRGEEGRTQHMITTHARTQPAARGKACHRLGAAAALPPAAPAPPAAPPPPPPPAPAPAASLGASAPGLDNCSANHVTPSSTPSPVNALDACTAGRVCVRGRVGGRGRGGTGRWMRRSIAARAWMCHGLSWMAPRPSMADTSAASSAPGRSILLAYSRMGMRAACTGCETVKGVSCRRE